MELYEQIKKLAKEQELYEEPTYGLKASFRNQSFSTVLTVTHKEIVTMEGHFTISSGDEIFKVYYKTEIPKDAVKDGMFAKVRFALKNRFLSLGRRVKEAKWTFDKLTPEWMEKQGFKKSKSDLYTVPLRDGGEILVEFANDLFRNFWFSLEKEDWWVHVDPIKVDYAHSFYDYFPKGTPEFEF